VNDTLTSSPIDDESPSSAVSKTVAPQQILAFNDAEASENKIHSDDIATRYGFKGALVSGVNLFGYLTQSLVRCYGADWLERGIMDVVFLKPAFAEELLSIRTETLGSESSKRNHLSCLYNESDQLLAKLESWLPDQLPEPSEHLEKCSASAGAVEARPEISWDEIKLLQSAPAYLWTPDSSENEAHVEIQRDQSALYKGDNAYLQPYLILKTCNKALMNMFVMPAWIHTGSKLVLRRPLRVGQNISVRCMPIDKWERRGHQFIKLYIAMLVDDELALEVEHSAIFRIAS